jgi:hypothetical protein
MCKWIALTALLLIAGNLVAGPLGSAFTYQGLLDAAGGPANGSYDLQFAVFDASNGGSQIGSTLTNSATAVSNGLFTVTLDFGTGVFNGASRWMAIAVRTNGTSPFVPLSPLQPILPAPYAITATSASNLLGTLPSSQLAGTYSSPVTFSAASGTFSGTFSGDGSGLSNLSASQLAAGTVPDSRLSANVPLLNGTNLFTRTNVFSGAAILTNANNVLRGMFAGNGAGLTNLTVPAANLTGLVPLAQLPSAVLTNNESGVSLSGNFAGNGGGLTNLPGGFKWQVVAGSSQQAQPNGGYVAISATLVTIILPASPALGDIVRVTGAGAGGWRIAQYPGQSVLAVNLGLVGAAWTPRASNLNWRCVASSSDGTKLVAGVDGGPIYTSTDSGANWTPRAGVGPWYAVASSADGTKLVAGVNNGQIFTSADSGGNWTARPVSGQWYSIASSSDGTKLVAVSLNGQIYTSTTSGVTWTPRDSARQWYSVASSSDGTKLVAVVYGGQIYTSTDSGQNWTPRDISRYWYSVASSGDGTKLVAVAIGGQIYTSTDSGVSWSPHDSAQQWYSVASSADGSKLVAVANNGQIYTSTDSGGTWTPRDASRAWYAVTSSADGSKLVAVVYGGQIYTSGLASTTPGASGYLLGGQNAAIELQYIGNNQFLPLSHEGAFFTY